MSDLSLSILMPVYNEENTIAEVIDRVLAIDVNLKELVIVDDGSKDNTVSIIHELAKSRPKINFFPQPKNKGKSTMLRPVRKRRAGPVDFIGPVLSEVEGSRGRNARCLLKSTLFCVTFF